MLNFIHSRLGFGARLALISALFCAPIALLVWLFVSNVESQVQFSQSELDGAVYLQQVWGSTLNGGPLADDAGRFKDADAAHAFNAAKSPSDRLAAGQSLIGAIADGSNLTLDPDLDSFYTMDETTVRLPALYVAAATLTSALATGDSTKIAEGADGLDSAASQAQASLQAAMKDNAEGRTRAALSDKAAALAQAVSAAKASLATPAAAPAAIAALQAKVADTWTASDTELNRLLRARLDKLNGQLVTNLAIVAAALALAAALAFAIARALSQRVGRLIAVMERLSTDDTQVIVPFTTDVNETGRIAKALEVFKAGITERGRLQAQANVVNEANERKLRETEEAFRDAGRAQTKVVETLAAAMSQLSDRNLTTRIDDVFPQDYEALKRDFNAAVEALDAAIGAVADASNGLRTGVDEITAAADDLSRRTENQAASLEETAAALDEITATVNKTASEARKASDAVGSAKSVAEKSGSVVRGAVAAMGGIEQSSSQISQIIGVIDEIAFQTNLLALNAGVEAARAGDAGRGFAVVASEVRALAQRSADAAKEIKALISTSSQQVAQGVDLVAQAGKALESIVARVNEIDGLVSGISESAQEQSSALNEVNTAVNQMDQVVQQNAAMVEQSTAASRVLRAETTELVRMVSEFRIAGRAGRSSARAAPVRVAQPVRAVAGEGPARALTRKVAARVGAAMPAAAEDWSEF